jgi:hypothetical protein
VKLCGQLGLRGAAGDGAQPFATGVCDRWVNIRCDQGSVYLYRVTHTMRSAIAAWCARLVSQYCP